MKSIFRTVSCLSLVFLAACSNHSNYDIRFADAAKAPAKAGQFAGAYSGRWTSASHPGGGGDLRCILTEANGSKSDFLADFHATWHGFSSEHTVVLHTKPAAGKKSGVRDFEGTSKLRMIIGSGTYTCKGSLKPLGNTASMSACYDATYDKGTFQLKRVAPNGAAH